jgi:hypothetical protein
VVYRLSGGCCNEKATLKGSSTVLITALGSSEKPVPRGHAATNILFGLNLRPEWARLTE